MSILGNSRHVVIESAEMTNAGRDVKTTTQHASSAFTSSSDQMIVMEQPNVLNAGGNITYITWNFQLLEMVAAALALAFSPFRTTSERQCSKNAESSTTGRNVTSHDESTTISELNGVEIGITMCPSYDEGIVCLAIRKVGSVLSKAYIENMIQLGIGYPMWNPQPHRDLPLGYRRSGISFGDLGAITDDGDFDFLFNVLLKAKDPVNVPADLPDDYDIPQRPKVLPRLRTAYNSASTLSNLRSIKTELDKHSKDISSLCNDSAAGSILLLPHGASESDLRNVGHWKRYISRNALSWYKISSENCGRDLDRHSLYVVAGHMKSKSWGLVTLNTPATERNDVLVLGKSTDPNDPPYIWKKFDGASIYKSGPMPDQELRHEFLDDDIENQCLFLRGFKISLSEQVWKELRDASDIDMTIKDNQTPAKLHSFGDNKSKSTRKDETKSFSTSHGNLGNGVSLSNFPTKSDSFHPSNIINDLLLSLVPEAHIAITHDSVWMDIVQSKNYNDKEMLAAVFGSRFVASYCQDTGMCTFESVEKLIPVLKEAGLLSQANIEHLESLKTIFDNRTPRGMGAIAHFLELFTRILTGKNQSDTLASMNNLAMIYYKQGKWIEAMDILTLVLDVHIKVRGEEHPDTLATMTNLALTYYEQGKWTEAENIQNQVLEIQTRILGKWHPSTLTTMNNMSLTYYKQGKLGEAKDIQVQVLDMRKRILGKEDPRTLTSINNLAEIYCAQGNWNQAYNFHSQVLGLRRRTLGEEHPDTLTSMNNVAGIYFQLGHWNEAKNRQLQIVDMHTRALGKEHPDTLTSMHNLALTYYKLKKFNNAESIHSEVLEMRTRIIGKEHHNTVSTMSILAQIYYAQAKWTEVECIQKEIIELYTKLLGIEHPKTFASFRHLALTYQKLGKTAEADKINAQALEIWGRDLYFDYVELSSNTLKTASNHNLRHTRKDTEPQNLTEMSTISQKKERSMFTIRKDSTETVGGMNKFT